MTSSAAVRPGQVFGKLTIVAIGADSPSAPKGAEPHKYHRYRRWTCLCECGREKLILETNLVRATRPSRSCGCVSGQKLREHTMKHGHSVRVKHGKTSTPEYRAWGEMKTRCYNENRPSYKYYGGKGIRVCAEWLADFEAFFRDMGPKPAWADSIDRIDGDKDYEPGNCRWATTAQQARNTARNHWLELDGRKVILEDASKEAGLLSSTVHRRLSRGLSVKDALAKEPQCAV